jgi:hypothetical protein
MLSLHIKSSTPQRKSRHELFIAIALILVGTAVRVRDYWGNRSLWRDEAALAVNFLHRSFFGMLKPLDNQQAAPVGFLLVQKLAATILGTSERGLRFIPLMASIAAVVVFWRLCRLLLTPRATLLALGLLSLNYRQYYYAQEVKQYSTDVFVAITLLYTTAKLLLLPSPGTPGEGQGGGLFDEPSTSPYPNPPPEYQGRGKSGIPGRRGLIILGVLGALAVWFSHPAVFVLAGIGVTSVWVLRKTPPRELAKLGWVFLAWVLSFALEYVLILRPLSRDGFMQSFWSAAEAFGPIPKSIGALIWYKKRFLEIFDDPMGGEFVGLSAMIYVLGAGVLFRRNKTTLMLLTLPIAFVLAASIPHKYPFRSRMIMFIVPLLVATIGVGLDWLLEEPRRLVGIVAAVFLFESPFFTTLNFARHVQTKNDIRASMSYVGAHKQPGDVYYVYPHCQYAFTYYQNRFGLSDARAIVGAQGVAGWDVYQKDLSQLAGHRAWVFFEDTNDHDGMNEQAMALHILDSMGKCVDVPAKQPYGEYVACYDLRSADLP